MAYSLALLLRFSVLDSKIGLGGVKVSANRISEIGIREHPAGNSSITRATVSAKLAHSSPRRLAGGADGELEELE